MHPGAFEFVGRYATTAELSVIEIGSRDINGSVKPHFPNAIWTGLDLYPGPGVDFAIDALDYEPADRVDLVVCCEVMEHSAQWTELIDQAWEWLLPKGRIIITCAGPGRDPHSAIDGGQLHPDEYYANISQQEMREALEFATFQNIEVSGNEYWKDTYAIAWKL